MIYTKHVIRIDTDQHDSNINTRSLKTIPSLLDINNFENKLCFKISSVEVNQANTSLVILWTKKCIFKVFTNFFLGLELEIHQEDKN